MNQIVSRSRKFYSPLRYPGGKSSLSNFFVNMLERMGSHCSEYAEPYSGGAGAALTLLLLEKVERIFINDFDKSIYFFWKSLICDSERFIDKIMTVSLTIEEWMNQKNIFAHSETEFDKGFSVFYLNRTNISGIISGGPIGGLSQSGKWKIDARFNRMELVKRIKLLSKYKDRISISNEDGIVFMSKLVTSHPDCFIYIDPPYYKKGSCLYLNSYAHNDHLLLANFLNSSNFKWILTYDNVKEILEMYPDNHKREFDITYHSTLPRKSKEIMIFSNLLKEFDSYYCNR